MVLEIATLTVHEGRIEEFEASFAAACHLIASIPGYVSHRLSRSIEHPNRYVLLVRWTTLEAHTIGFRKSHVYEEWKARLHHFYELTAVEHFEISGGEAAAIEGVHHIQLAMPEGGEPAARRFYSGLFGIPEVPKPENLLRRGGVWFESADVRVHLGVEPDFRPARKAHPGLLVRNLDELTNRLRAAGVEVVDDDRIQNCRRAYVNDPFGNRIELMEPEFDGAP